MKFALSLGSKKSMVGLDIGSSTVKAVELTAKGKHREFELTHLGVAKLPADAIVQGAFLNSGAIADAIREAVDIAKIKATSSAKAPTPSVRFPAKLIVYF